MEFETFMTTGREDVEVTYEEATPLDNFASVKPKLVKARNVAGVYVTNGMEKWKVPTDGAVKQLVRDGLVDHKKGEPYEVADVSLNSIPDTAHKPGVRGSRDRTR